MKKISLFIGPKKTGTSWLHHTITGSSRMKEFRYPAKIGRKYVYNRYVKNKSVLIWPYLLHDRSSLGALLEDLDKNNVEPAIYVSLRDEENWLKSMSKFAQKYGANAARVERIMREETAAVERNLAWVESRFDVTKLHIINANDSEFETMSAACNVSKESLLAARDTQIYASGETANIPSRHLIDTFFKIKPFLPEPFQEVTKNKIIRSIFFRHSE